MQLIFPKKKIETIQSKNKKKRTGVHTVIIRGIIHTTDAPDTMTLKA